MAFMTEQDRETLRARFDADLTGPVRIVVFSEPRFGLYVPGRRDCLSCSETEELMKEVGDLSDDVTLEIHNVREEPDLAAEWNVSFTPTIAVCREEDSGVRFLGLPGGFEFASFVDTVISASAGDASGLQPASVELLGQLDSDLDLKIFVTPT